MTTKLLKAEKVAEILDVSKQRIYELTREKQIPFIQIGERQYRYSETAILNWIENGGSNSQTEAGNVGLDA
ncbi:MAG TPA: helix-turn-helix domain-containing protein [Pyrinomonadaceae bacterium]|jgi:excisionase family DNA binding protein